MMKLMKSQIDVKKLPQKPSHIRPYTSTVRCCKYIRAIYKLTSEVQGADIVYLLYLQAVLYDSVLLNHLDDENYPGPKTPVI